MNFIHIGTQIAYCSWKKEKKRTGENHLWLSPQWISSLGRVPKMSVHCNTQWKKLGSVNHPGHSDIIQYNEAAALGRYILLTTKTVFAIKWIIYAQNGMDN